MIRVLLPLKLSYVDRVYAHWKYMFGSCQSTVHRAEKKHGYSQWYHNSLSLSLFLSWLAGKPKKAGALITICLMLGPDFISDTITVETSDHARLKIALSMNNMFRVSNIHYLFLWLSYFIPSLLIFICKPRNKPVQY